jgi:hypothetical protein
MMLGLSKRAIAERFDEIVHFAELEEFIDAPVKTYSSGMYMRLGFAVAINVDPDVLLVDEVLAVGDQAFTHKCLDKFAEFRQRGRTVLIVTHSLDMVSRFCDEALWLDGGRMRLQGKPAHVIDAYLANVARSEQDARPAAAPSLPRDVEIVDVTLLAADGLPAGTITSGTGVTIRAHVHAHRPVSDVVFSFAIFNADGIRCCDMSTADTSPPRGGLNGGGTVTCVIERLDLSAGTYTLDLSAERPDGTTYDRDHRCTFTVASALKSTGIFHPRHHWGFGGGFRAS